jgi:cytochrome P450 family 142 subfamily A polypeptide 1
MAWVFLEKEPGAPYATFASVAVSARPPLDLLDGEFYVRDTYRQYAWFRQHEPVAWDEGNELWGIFRYDDVLEIEKNKQVFISSDQHKGGYRPNLPADPSIIGLDDPVHVKRRNLVSRRFTPRAVQSFEDHVRQVSVDLIETAVAKGHAEIVSELASVLPAIMIGRLLGFPDELWPSLRDWSERTIQLGGGPRYFTDDGREAATEFGTAAFGLYESKKGCPADDVMSVWTTAEVDGRPLSVHDVVGDCLLLLDGGAETTRTVIARTILNLIADPEQWRLLKAGADMAVATEEFIRFVTPIHNMCRTAVRDYDIGGVTVRAGQQVVLMYGSANRDPEHFVDPERFDVTRQPNSHLAFGFGTHFCLGAALARLEITTFFEQLRRRVAGMRLAPGTAVVEMPNAFVYGLREATVDFDPA